MTSSAPAPERAPWHPEAPPALEELAVNSHKQGCYASLLARRLMLKELESGNSLWLECMLSPSFFGEVWLGLTEHDRHVEPDPLVAHFRGLVATHLPQFLEETGLQKLRFPCPEAVSVRPSEGGGWWCLGLPFLLFA